MGSFNSTCALTRNPIEYGEPVILFPIYCGIDKEPSQTTQNNSYGFGFAVPNLAEGWKFCLNESNQPMPLYGCYDDYGLFNLAEASLVLNDEKLSNIDKHNQSNNFKGGKNTSCFLNFLKSNLLPTERGSNQYNDNEINPEIFIKEVEQFFKSSNAQCLSFNSSQEDFKVYGKEIFRFEYLLIKHPENPNEIANLRFCVMSYPMIAKVLNLPEHSLDECNCEYDYHQIQLALEKVYDSYAGLSGFDKCIQYFLNNVPVIKPALSSGEQEIFNLQKLLSKFNNNDMVKSFQEKTNESKTCSLTLLPINKGDTFYMIPIQYELKQYGNNPYVYPSYLNFYDPFMQLFYDDRFSLDKFLTQMIKCKLSDNGAIQISDDNIISQNPMLNIIKYHEYPYFMPSKSASDGYEIRCGISKGVVYDCLLISEHAIQLLINEFKEVSQLDVVKNNEKIDYELMLQFPILGHITSSKFAYNTIYQKLHQHLAILDWFGNANGESANQTAMQGEAKTNQKTLFNDEESEINIQYILDCFKPQDNMNGVDKFLKIGILLHTLFTIADSMMFTYLDMCGEARRSCNSNNSKINPNLEQFWLDLYGEVI